MILRSSVLARPALAWLQARRTCKILHVFDQAYNLINEEGRILSIVGPEFTPGPFSLVLEKPFPQAFREGIDLTTSVSVQSDRLEIGSYQVEWGDAEPWDSRPDWQTLQKNRPRIFNDLEELEVLGGRYAPTGSFFYLLSPREEQQESGSRLTKEFALQQAAAPAKALGEGVVQLDLDRVRKAARELSGLGSGLTPAGDDFLCGALMASRILMRPGDHEQIHETMMVAALGRTNALSMAYINAAGLGEIHQDWHQLLQRWVDGSSSNWKEVLKRICGWGHSSGADTLGGFLRVMSDARGLGGG
jgi:hypothetical protein